MRRITLIVAVTVAASAAGACSFKWDDYDPRLEGAGAGGDGAGGDTASSTSKSSASASASVTSSGTTSSTAGSTTSSGATTSSSASSSVAASSSSGMVLCNGPQDCAGFNDACNVGVCDPNTGCFKQAANNGAGCDDGLFCTTGDTCQGGTCQGAPLQCPPTGNPCIDAQCDENSDQCINVPGNDGAGCDDGDPCTQSSTCAGGTCTNGQPVGCVSGDGCCPAGCAGADSDCGMVLVGAYTIGMGANWTTNPATETCQEACSIVFGGSPGQYACSTSAGAVDHLAWVDGYADVAHCQGNGSPVSESFKLNSNYDCGMFGCAYSAYVSDNCPGSTNYCWQ